MKNLIAGRTRLRKKIRTNIDDGQLQAAKDEIASINGEVKKLRREVKLCEEDVYKRQGRQRILMKPHCLMRRFARHNLTCELLLTFHKLSLIHICCS